MTSFPWFKTLRNLLTRPSVRRPFRRANRLRVEALESRDVPSAAGSLDPTFGVGGLVTTDFTLPVDTPIDFRSFDVGASVAVQPDGKIVAAGLSYQAADFQQIDFAIARYLPNGNLDTSFGTGGKQLIDFGGNDYCSGLVVQADGKIVVAGYTERDDYAVEDLVVARLNALDGSLDTTFGIGGKQTIDFGGLERLGDHGLAVQPDDKIVVVGFTAPGATLTDLAVARLNTNGSLDTSFDVDGKKTIDLGGDDYASSVAVQTVDGVAKLVVAGTTFQLAPGAEYALPFFAVVRLNSVDGSLDPTFDGDGKQFIDGEGAVSVAVQTDGKIVLAGRAYSSSPEAVTYSDFAVVRLNGDGSLDTTFDGDGKQSIDFLSFYDYLIDAAVQADGKIVVTGYAGTEASTSFAVARLNGDGSLDTSFGGDGKQIAYFGSNSEAASGVVVQTDGNIVVSGYAYSDNSYTDLDFALARFVGNENVTSLPNAENGNFVTLQAPAGTTLTSVTAVAAPAPADRPGTGLPQNAVLPVGAFDFTVSGVTPGSPVEVVLIMPAGTSINAYYKFNSATNKWSKFNGAQFGVDRNSDGTPDVVLTLTDGGAGDQDGVANGVIVDPGAPAFVETLQVQIDIRSTLNLASQGRIAVAIFSTADFDAALVNAASVQFAGASAVQWALEDVNGDGLLDMVLQFRTQDTNLRAIYEQLLADDINADGVLDSNHQEATIALTGSTTGDEQFEGSDTLDLFLSGRNLRDMLAELAASGAI